ncbi:hypothetical protein MJD09_14425, partial [bacterium]|nr:hypothetical protein [bacterium]
MTIQDSRNSLELVAKILSNNATEWEAEEVEKLQLSEFKKCKKIWELIDRLQVSGERRRKWEESACLFKEYIIR